MQGKNVQLSYHFTIKEMAKKVGWKQQTEVSENYGWFFFENMSFKLKISTAGS